MQTRVDHYNHHHEKEKRKCTRAIAQDVNKSYASLALCACVVDNQLLRLCNIFLCTRAPANPRRTSINVKLLILFYSFRGEFMRFLNEYSQW